MKVLDTAWQNLVPVRLARCKQTVDKYLTEIRHGYSARECSEKAALVMRAIYDEDVESCIDGPRDPFVDDRQFPSMPLLMHLRMRFSNQHEDTGWNSLQIMRLQHYELIFRAVEKRLTLLRPLLEDIKSKKGTGRGLKGAAGPGNYPAIEAVTLQACTIAKLPPGTPVPMTEKAWRYGWDAAMKQSGAPPVNPADNRPLLLGQYIQFLLAITQWLCPICLRRLLRDHDLENIFTVAAAMMTLHFDHQIPFLKNTANPGHVYKNCVYWYQLPMVLELNVEKLSGCFVHQTCHRKGQ
jgi:hypothetical protein